MPYKLFYLERRPGFVTRKVGDAYMIVPTGPRLKEYRGMITVNETGAFLFDHIKQRRTTQDLINLLMIEYGITAELAFKAISSFVDQCGAANLLVYDEVDEIDENQKYFTLDRSEDGTMSIGFNGELERPIDESKPAEPSVDDEPKKDENAG